MTHLLLICGALRRDSFNRKLLNVAAGLHSGTSEHADLNMPLYDGDLEAASGLPEAAQKLKDQIAAADAVLIATPEYNQSFSGVLKNALDWASRGEGNPWAEKPVAIVSAAAGRTGGARAQYALRLAMTPFQPRLITGPEVLVASAFEAFDEAGALKNERYLKGLQALVETLTAG
ncbi:MAG: NAD(P)H-dependent oxidoreductase [Silicimonas sp.]|nr:NAD(P)H-dependent oxidoreductase [Silicimonas sp.]